MKLGDHGDRSRQVFRFGNSDVKLLEVSLVLQIMDVRDDKGVEHVAKIIRMEMDSRSTCVLIVADGLLHQTLVLSILELLKHRLNGGLESAEKCLRVELVIGIALIRMISDVRAPATTANAGGLSERFIVRSIR